MENILGILARLNQEYEDSTNKHIAKVVLDNYSQGKFLTLKQLADEAHYSESLITIFCKRLGFSGYRQFNERLKMEYEKYYQPLERNNNFEVNIEEMSKKFQLFLNDIKNNDLFFSNLLNKIEAKKSLIILSSYQTRVVSQFISNLLNGKGYDCKFYLPSENDWLAEDFYFRNETPILCFLTGNNNDHIFRILNKKDKEREEIFFITSNGQKEKIKEYKNKFVIASHNSYNNFFYRTVLLETLFLIIFRDL